MSTVKHVQVQEVLIAHLAKMDIICQVRLVFQAILEDPIGLKEEGQVEVVLTPMEMIMGVVL